MKIFGYTCWGLVIAWQVTSLPPRTDWNPLVTALSILVIALAAAVPGLMAYFAAKQAAAEGRERSAKADVANALATEAAKEIKNKVDGNYSDLKTEVSAAKAEVVLANQRIAVLTERLITSTPATAAPPVAMIVNGTPKG